MVVMYFTSHEYNQLAMEFWMKGILDAARQLVACKSFILMDFNKVSLSFMGLSCCPTSSPLPPSVSHEREAERRNVEEARISRLVSCIRLGYI